MKRVVLSVLALAGCNRQPHVSLPALPLDNPPDQRVALFSQYRPVVSITESKCNQAGCATQHESIRLANGIEVSDPVDLIPLVGESSRTAKAAHAAHRDYAVVPWLGVGVGVGLIGGVLYLGHDLSRDPTTTDKAVSAALILAGAVCFFAAERYHAAAVAEDAEAYDVYQRELGARLNVCSSGLAVVPCEAPPSQQLRPPGGL